MSDRCPGSQALPTAVYFRDGKLRCICRYCRREYSFVNAPVMRPHVHNGLPPRPDGGCPYTCPAECDFNCYHPKGD